MSVFSLATLAAVYVLGGLTFLPLVLGTAWVLLKRVDGGERVDGGAAFDEGGEDAGVGEEGLKARYEGDTTAEGSFAVLRSFHFGAAVAALNAKGSSGGGGGGGSGGGGGETMDGAVEGGSVYQNIYRSVFDRKKEANTASAVLESAAAAGDGAPGRLRKKPSAVGASVFYIVLRHGHLMLYDSPAQGEVRHVISLAHHAVSLSAGPDPADPSAGGDMPDGDLFIKRTAIVLTPTHLPPAPSPNPHPPPPKPYFLFSATSTLKEDFYHALLATTPHPPTPQPLAPQDLINLQSTLHSTHLTPETRALNALLTRLFLALHRTPALQTILRAKIETKIARAPKPAFLTALQVHSIDLGRAAPLLSNPRLKTLSVDGDMTIALDVRYTGCPRLILAARATIDLGPRFKARTLALLLSTTLTRFQGHMLVRVKPPPSNRIWFCFEQMPEMEVKVEPVVSSRQITYTFILRAIEERVRAVVGETLVRPNWDDVPFFDTRGQGVRGGIWADEGGERGGVEGGEGGKGEGGKAESGKGESGVDGLGVGGEKTGAMSALPTPMGMPSDTETLAAAVSGFDTSTTAPTAAPQQQQQQQQTSTLKRRPLAPPSPSPSPSSTSLPSPARYLPPAPPPPPNPPHPPTPPHPPPPPPPLRSPSSASPPSLSLDGAFALPVRTDDAALQPPKPWRHRAPPPPSANRASAAVHGLREISDRAPVAATTTAASSGGSLARELGGGGDIISPGVVGGGGGDDTGVAAGARELVDTTTTTPADADASSAASSLHSADRAPWSTPLPFPRAETASERSSSTAATTTTTQLRRQEQRRNLLAATAAAGSAARAWGWNALAGARGRGGVLGGEREGNGNGDGSERGVRAGGGGGSGGVGRLGSSGGSSFSSFNSGGGGGGGSGILQTEPFGRGKPLPPPGTPLPGPERAAPKSLWSAAAGLAAGGVGGRGRGRKPVLPPRRGSRGEGFGGMETGVVRGVDSGEVGERFGAQRQAGDAAAEEEWGVWKENSGAGLDSLITAGDGQDLETGVYALPAAGFPATERTPTTAQSGAAPLAQAREHIFAPAAAAQNDEQPRPAKARNVPPPLPARRQVVGAAEAEPDGDLVAGETGGDGGRAVDAGLSTRDVASPPPAYEGSYGGAGEAGGVRRRSGHEGAVVGGGGGGGEGEGVVGLSESEGDSAASAARRRTQQAAVEDADDDDDDEG
ncbi:hypothetical protein LTR08_004018 [Meristemomyces frigidus]|nr:hypothetical protein LTR08_004018 [Meristemomyces frigidus]